MIKNFLCNIMLSVLGCIISSFGTACFLLPNKLSSGGFSGIATIFYYFFEVKMGTTILILNIPLFIIAYFRLGKRFFCKTIISTIIFSYLIDMFDKLTVPINDRFLASIYGGIFIGLGQALIFKAKSSTGGSDLIASLVNSFKPGFRMGNALVVLDTIIVILNLIFFKNIEIGLYSAIAIYVVGKMIDIVFEGINFSKMIYIISDKYEEIAYRLNIELERGGTGLYGKGLYTQKDKMIIMCVTKRNNLIEIEDLAKKIDSEAFIIITDVREVYGEGFKNR